MVLAWQSHLVWGVQVLDHVVQRQVVDGGGGGLPGLGCDTNHLQYSTVWHRRGEGGKIV